MFIWFDKKQTWLLEVNTVWKRFVKDLKEHATKIFNYEKKEMIPLTDEKNKSYEKQKVTYAEKNLILMMRVIKSIIKL